MKVGSAIKDIALCSSIFIVTGYYLFSQSLQQLLSLLLKNLIILPTRTSNITSTICTPSLILLWFSQNSGSRSHLLEDHHQGTERTTFKTNVQII